LRVPNTPEGWRDKLLKDLAARRPDIDRLYCYYRGDHPLPWAPTEVRDAYRAFLRMSRSNWCRLIVKAPSERLRVVGLRFSDQDQGDTEAWKRYWQSNRLDAESRMVHDPALIARRGFTLVWPGENGAPPTITPEHPSQVIVEYQPGNRRNRLAGLKVFTDPTAKRAFCTLWLPDAVYQWTGPESIAAHGTSSRWEPWNDETQGILAESPNPLRDVPLVEFVADPALLGEPMSELDGGVTDIQDRINKTILDRLVTSNFASFKQRWATGLEIPKDEQGNDVEPYKAAVDRMFINENPEGRFGEFDASDLQPYISGVEADIQHLAAITRTPPHYLLGQSGAFPSGESLKATETGLVAKVLERRDSFTESWEDTIRLALKADGDKRADDLAMSMVWKEPESRSLAEVVDAAVKLDSIGVPWREVMSFVGYSPTDIDRLELERAEDQADGLLQGPAKTTITEQAGGTPPTSTTPAAPAGV
jgi:hypothetical protein